MTGPFLSESCSRFKYGWMTCDFTSFFNSISVISGRCADNNERLCAMEPHLRLRRFRLE